LLGILEVTLNEPAALTVAVVQLKSAPVGLSSGLSRSVTLLDGFCIHCEKLPPATVTSAPILAAAGTPKPLPSTLI